MNKGLYKAKGYIAYYESWKNSSENFGASISFVNNSTLYQLHPWENVFEIRDSNLVGAACLAQW